MAKAKKTEPKKVEPPPKSTRPAYVKAAAEKVATVEDDKQTQLGRELAEWKAKKEQLEENLKLANTKIDTISLELGGYCEAKGVSGFKMPGIGTFYLQHKNRPNVVDRAGFIAWLDENGMGEMAQRTVHPKTLEGWVNDWLKDAKALPPMINNFVQVRMMLRRS